MGNPIEPAGTRILWIIVSYVIVFCLGLFFKYIEKLIKGAQQRKESKGKDYFTATKTTTVEWPKDMPLNDTLSKQIIQSLGKTDDTQQK